MSLKRRIARIEVNNPPLTAEPYLKMSSDGCTDDAESDRYVRRISDAELDGALAILVGQRERELSTDSVRR